MEIYNIPQQRILSKRCAVETKKDLQNNQEVQQKKELAPIPSTKQYLAFTGGYSLNLAETIQNLDKLAQKNSNIYPKNIREWAGMVLEGGNNAKQTLIDIHKRYYESLKDCKTLSTAKDKFKEFENVLSDKDVSFSKNSFGYNVKQGLLDAFDKDEDLSLQLLKLYYGEGFSLNDLKAYAGDTDLFHTMKKLQIPTVSRDYGHILKFSDPQYNERLTKEMTYRRRLAMDAKAQEAGEPVHIPRGPLSKEHKEHISEGLRKFYANNPERIFDMSEKQKMFYQDNPEKAQEFSRVMKKAWNIFGADRIKSAMSKFMKANKVKDFNPEINPVDIPKEQGKILRRFWATNEWARKSFSKNMEFAWKKVKEENEIFFSVQTVPTRTIKFVEEKAGLESGMLKTNTVYNPYTQESRIDDFSQEVFRANISKNDIYDVLVETYQQAICKAAQALRTGDYNDKDSVDLKNLIMDIYSKNTNIEEYHILKKVTKTLNNLTSLAVSDMVKNNDFSRFNELSSLIGQYKDSIGSINEAGMVFRPQTLEDARHVFMRMACFAAEKKQPRLQALVTKAMDDAFEEAMTKYNKTLQ